MAVGLYTKLQDKSFHSCHTRSEFQQAEVHALKVTRLRNAYAADRMCAQLCLRVCACVLTGLGRSNSESGQQQYTANRPAIL